MKKVALTLILTSAAIAMSGCQQKAEEPAPEPTEAAPVVEAPVEPAVEAPVETATDAAAPEATEAPAADATAPAAAE